MTSSAVSYAISSNIAFYFVAMHNGASLFGSVGLGFLAVRLGIKLLLSVVFLLLTTYPRRNERSNPNNHLYWNNHRRLAILRNCRFAQCHFRSLWV